MPWIFKTNKNRALKHPTFPNHESCDQMQTPVVYLIKIKPSFPFPFFSFSSSTPSNACGKIHHLEAGFLWDLTKIIQESIFCQKLSDKSSGLHIIILFFYVFFSTPPPLFIGILSYWQQSKWGMLMKYEGFTFVLCFARCLSFILHDFWITAGALRNRCVFMCKTHSSPPNSLRFRYYLIR